MRTFAFPCAEVEREHKLILNLDNRIAEDEN